MSESRAAAGDGPVLEHGAGATEAMAGTATGLTERRLRWHAYLRMGRTIRYENWLCTPLWWCAVPAAVAFKTTTLLLVPLTLLIYMSLMAAGGTLDDVQGYRDGSDRINYLRSDPTGLRPLTRKPLLLGWVTQDQALRYATAMAVVAAAALVTSWLVAGARPLWWLPAYGVTLALASQYSFGLKLSYHGLQEVLFGSVKACTVLFPYVLATGHLSSGVAVSSAVYGLWFLQVLVCSNAHDIEGDRQARRRTIAVMASETAYRRFLVGLFAISWLLPVIALVSGVWSPWLFIATIPIGVVHAYQLYLIGYRRLPLQARAAGFWALRIGVLCLCIAYLGVR